MMIVKKKICWIKLKIFKNQLTNLLKRKDQLVKSESPVMMKNKRVHNLKSEEERRSKEMVLKPQRRNLREREVERVKLIKLCKNKDHKT